MSEIKEKQFVEFFQDKSNISQSSYKVDSKTNLPIVYTVKAGYNEPVCTEIWLY